MTQTADLRSNQLARRGIQLLFVIVPLLLAGRYYLNNWEALSSYEWRINLTQCIVSLLVLLLAFAILPCTSRHVLIGLGYQVTYPVAYYSYFVSQLAKYIPGRFWIVPARAVALEKYGIDALSSSVGAIIEVCVLLLTGVIAFVPYALVVPNTLFSKVWYLIVPLAVSLHPRVFNTGMRWLQRRLGHHNAVVQLTGRQIARMVLLDLLFWAVAGIGFVSLVTSVKYPLEHLWVLPSAFSLSWVLGFLAVITPGGFGVREGMLTLLLTPLLPQPLPALVAVLSRLWWTLGDLVSAVLAFLANRVVGRSNEC